MRQLALGLAVLAMCGFCSVGLAKDKAPKDPGGDAKAGKAKADKPLTGEIVTVTPDKGKDKDKDTEAVAAKPDCGEIAVKSPGKKKTDPAVETKVTSDKDTKVTLDDKDAKIADLKAGMKVSISPATGTAKEIKMTTAAKTHKGGKKGGDKGGDKAGQ